MHGYIAIVKTVPGGGYKAVFPDLPDCRASGCTVEDALVRAKAALKAHGADMLRSGLAMPAPRGSDEVFGIAAAHGAVGGACLELRDVSVRMRLRDRSALPAA